LSSAAKKTRIFGIFAEYFIRYALKGLPCVERMRKAGQILWR
jgi:hypothetical protein